MVVYGQESIITKTGQEVLIYSDGTWIQKNKLNQALFEDETSTDASVFEVPDADKNSLTTGQKVEIETIINLLEEKEAKVAVNLYQGSKKINQFKESFHITPKADRSRIMNRIKEQEILNASTNNNYIKISDFIFSAKELYDIPSNIVNKKTGYLKAKIAQEYGIDFGTIKQDKIEKIADIEDNTLILPTYPTSFAVSETDGPRAPYKCNITFDGRDSLTRRRKKETGSDLFFSFTQEKLKPYFKQDNFLTCESQISKVGKSYYVTLTFILKSKDASKTYGSLKENDEMRITFIDGDEIFGANIINSMGEIEPYSGYTKFYGVYEFDKESIDKLSKKLIDNIGVFWSSGFEQYEIYNIDLLLNQIDCLKNG